MLGLDGMRLGRDLLGWKRDSWVDGVYDGQVICATTNHVPSFWGFFSLLKRGMRGSSTIVYGYLFFFLVHILFGKGIGREFGRELEVYGGRGYRKGGYFFSLEGI